VKYIGLTAVTMKILVLWVETSCSLMQVYRYIRLAYCLQNGQIASLEEQCHNSKNVHFELCPKEVHLWPYLPSGIASHVCFLKWPWEERSVIIFFELWQCSSRGAKCPFRAHVGTHTHSHSQLIHLPWWWRQQILKCHHQTAWHYIPDDSNLQN
jgi:hypothetical protein